MTSLTALALVCSLKKSETPSSSELLARQVLDELAEHGCAGDAIRVADHPVAFGVSTDEGHGDAWPTIREKVLAADIVVIATPIWMGQPSSVCKMVLERLDAEIGETDEQGRMSTYGKVGAIAVVGNEDGAHHVTAQVAQALTDVGFTLPPNAVTYWVGEAMHGTDYRDLAETPEKTAGTTRTLAANTTHLARLLRDAEYPPA
ncbi:MAG: NAD(P)H-dependent oxidoreductase [Nocardioidaceae bacterium]|nr:NAD(P)H-dependent oxidoreductase [Nocardioidaceae bacterium]MCL2613769.1 NAD(P)H-dependent oxidoreductase [Nocardioidaceae bacterium]